MLRTKMYISMYDVRNFCIKYDYYTEGTSKDYENLLSFVGYQLELTEDFIEYIVNNIINHSDLSEKLKQGYTHKDLVETMAYDLINEYVTHTVEYNK